MHNLSLLMSYIYNYMYLFQTMTKCITLRDACSFIHMFVFIYPYLYLIYTMYVKYVVGAINML